MTREDIELIARRLAAKANSCCNRTDGYEEDMFDAIKGSLYLVRDECAKTCEEMGAEGYGTLYIAAAIRGSR